MATAEDAPVLPEDLIVEILSWVEVKNLMRFRCVSKSWNSLIFNPTFIKLHLQRSSQNIHILLTFDQDSSNPYPYHDDNYISVVAAPCSIQRLLENPSSTIYNIVHFLEAQSTSSSSTIYFDVCYRFKHTYLFLGVCNGLVCLLDCLYEDEFEEYWVRFWNPATRAMSADSPHLRVHSSNYKLGDIAVKHAFGYDDSSDTYKVLAILFNVKSQDWELRVHCMGDDTGWRNVLTCSAFPILQQVYGQFVSGTLNWLALNNSSGSDHYQWETVTVDQLVIFSYDLKNETYSYLSMPDGLSEISLDEPYLGVLNGCLCLSHDHRRTNLVVWLMREFGAEKSWTQLLNVSYHHLQVLDFPPCPVVPLCKSENDDVLLLEDYGGGAEFVLVDKRDNSIDRMEGFNNGLSSFSAFVSHDYVQSLVLPYRN
ncbi:F-box/kelch-repeat protein [Glycine max]|nr:F-box/kelch-repeat protein [Glycine max]